jgi:hypothetical protein
LMQTRGLLDPSTITEVTSTMETAITTRPLHVSFDLAGTADEPVSLQPGESLEVRTEDTGTSTNVFQFAMTTVITIGPDAPSTPTTVRYGSSLDGEHYYSLDLTSPLVEVPTEPGTYEYPRIGSPFDRANRVVITSNGGDVSVHVKCVYLDGPTAQDLQNRQGPSPYHLS